MFSFFCPRAVFPQCPKLSKQLYFHNWNRIHLQINPLQLIPPDCNSKRQIMKLKDSYNLALAWQHCPSFLFSLRPSLFVAGWIFKAAAHRIFIRFFSIFYFTLDPFSWHQTVGHCAKVTQTMCKGLMFGIYNDLKCVEFVWLIGFDLVPTLGQLVLVVIAQKYISIH